MKKRSVYLITSSKGGVGKSTFAVNLAFTMALCGHTVLIADCDTKNRSVDLMLGYAGTGMFDLADVSAGRAETTEAILRDPRCERLYYATVPPVGFDIKPADAALAAVRCADAVNADCLIIDTSGGLDFPLAVYPDIVYEAIIVSTQSPTSLRAAERTGAELSHHGVKDLHLVINCFRTEKNLSSITDTIDETRLPLLGVIPYDEEMKNGQERGMPAAAVEESPSPRAFYNIAMRLCGADIPLFRGMRVRGRNKLLTRTYNAAEDIYEDML